MQDEIGSIGYIYRGDVTSPGSYDSKEPVKIHDIKVKEKNSGKVFKSIIDQNLRTGDSKEYRSVRLVKRNESLTHLGTTAGNWFKVRTEDGTEGYIYRGNVTFQRQNPVQDEVSDERVFLYPGGAHIYVKEEITRPMLNRTKIEVRKDNKLLNTQFYYKEWYNLPYPSHFTVELEDGKKMESGSYTFTINGLRDKPFVLKASIKDMSEIDVYTFPELETAVNEDKVKTINIMDNLKALDNIEIKRNITINGNDRIIDTSLNNTTWFKYSGGLALSGSEKITINDLTVKNSKGSNIYLLYADNCVFNNVRVENAAERGIELIGSNLEVNNLKTINNGKGGIELAANHYSLNDQPSKDPHLTVKGINIHQDPKGKETPFASYYLGEDGQDLGWVNAPGYKTKIEEFYQEDSPESPKIKEFWYIPK